MSKIIIRQYREEDYPGFYEAVIESKTELAKWFPWCHDDYDIEDAKKWVTETVPEINQSKKGAEFVIVESENDKIIGGCCLEQIDLINGEANIGYWIRSSETSKGIATFASRFLINYGFKEMNLDKILVVLSIKNIASNRVAKKLPYESFEIVKHGFRIRDNISDALVYNITRRFFEESELQRPTK